MLKKVILIIIILCSLKFYGFVFIPEVILKASEWLGIGLIIALIVIFLVYNKDKSIKKHFTLPIILIFISVLISMFGSYIFHDQSFIITAYEQRAIYFYLIYFLLPFMKIEGDFIIKTIASFALVYIVIYLLQFFIYPVQITDNKMFLNRGTLRIFLIGSGYLVISYFIWLYLAFRNYKVKHMLFLLFALAIFVLMGTRQVLATIVLLTLLYIIQSKQIKSKFLLFMLIGVALVPVFFLFQNIILAMFEVTREQSQNLEGSIRFEAAKFYLTKFYPDDLAYVIGNGAPGSSIYGLRLIRYSEEFGYYLSDIGLIGEYIKYGIVYVIGVFIILYRVFRKQLPEKLMFIKYNFLGIVLTLVTGGGAFGSSGANVLTNCLLLYLIDLHHSENQTTYKSLGD